MSREWKAGDVAMATATGGQFLVVRTGHGERAYWSAPTDWPRGVSDYECEFHPLVVIDPEDREAVERLQDLFADERDRNGGQSRLVVGGWADAMQAALREYANPKPPKPDEPQGLGAVVEDEDGVLWVRAGKELQTLDHWRATSGENLVGWWTTYDRIAAVRVLSPGVEVDQ